MEKQLICVVSLVIGTGLGFLLAKTTPMSGPKAAGPTLGGASVTMGDSMPSAGSASRSGQGSAAGSKRGSIDQLLALVNPYSSTYNRELSEAIDQLSLAAIVTLAAELENVPVRDDRSYQLRAALFSRWAQLDSNAAWLAATRNKNAGLKGGAMSAVLGEIARTDFTAARRLAEGLNNPQERQSAMNGIIAGGSQQKPEAVFDMVTQLSGQQTGWQYSRLFQQWARDQPDAAIAKFSGIKGQQNRGQALNGLVAGLATVDPDRAIAFAGGLENLNERNSALSVVAANIASTDPQRALKMLDDVPAGNQRRQMISSIALSWSGRDPNGAIAWMQTLPPGDKNAAMQNAIWQITVNDPSTAADMIGSMPISNNTTEMFQTVASQWAQSDPTAAAAWVETLPRGAGRQQAVNGLVSGLKNDEPAKAAAFLSKEGITNNLSYVAGNLFGSWVTTDPEAAVAWIDGLDLGSNAMRNVLSNGLNSWVQSDTAAATEYALGITDKDVQHQAVESLFSSWAQFDPVAAQDWALTNLEGDTKAGSLANFIRQAAYNDPDMALELYAQATAKLTDDEINESFSDVAIRIAQGWSQFDAPGAADWVMDLPEGDQRSASIQSIVDNWSHADPVAASEFVSTLPQGKERDGAVRSLVQQVQETDPEAAFIWAESIGDEQMRNSSVSDTAMQWKEIDADAAFQAVGNADISDEQKVKLLKQMQE
ncbi:MAG: hypothetical protein KDN22_26100 [Verrucomicrobiae bacterium]|nr:hypothetical protein [Verrucomicrobiae bacterium]